MRDENAWMMNRYLHHHAKRCTKKQQLEMNTEETPVSRRWFATHLQRSKCHGNGELVDQYSCYIRPYGNKKPNVQIVCKLVFMVFLIIFFPKFYNYFYMVFTNDFMILQMISWFHKWFHDFTNDFMILQMISWFYKWFHDFTNDFTWFYK